MIYGIDWADAATRAMRQLDPPIAGRIVKALDKLAATRAGDVKKLTGSGEYRLRVGDWRVRFEYDHANKALVVLSVAHRREAYR